MSLDNQPEVHPDAPTLKRINFQSGKIEVGEEIFYIQTNLSVIRYVEYLKRVPRLTFHTTFRGMYDSLSKIYMATSSGNDMIYAIQQARELAWNQLDAIKRFDEHEIPDIVDFCCLFLNRAGENIAEFDQTIHEQKKSIIVHGGYDASDFFTLAYHAVESFSEAYRKLHSMAEDSSTDIRLPLPSQQTSPTS